MSFIEAIFFCIFHEFDVVGYDADLAPGNSHASAAKQLSRNKTSKFRKTITCEFISDQQCNDLWLAGQIKFNIIDLAAAVVIRVDQRPIQNLSNYVEMMFAQPLPP